MTHRIQKMNKHLQRIVGTVLQREVDIEPETIVTVSRVDTTHNLKSATVWLYVFPLSRAPAVLKQLQSQLYLVQGAVNHALRMRPLPRLKFRIDYGADHADTVARRINELNHG